MIDTIKRIINQGYWKEHPEEKKLLEEEKEKLQNEISELMSEKGAISRKYDVTSIEEKIRDLVNKKSSLGFFKGKEKREIQQQIDELLSEKKALQEQEELDKMPIDRQINNQRDRVNAINRELHEIKSEIYDC